MVAATLSTDFAQDFERPGPFEKAASEIEPVCGHRVKVLERMVSEVKENGRPVLRLVLAIESDEAFVGDSPENCDGWLLLALKDFARRVERREGE